MRPRMTRRHFLILSGTLVTGASAAGLVACGGAASTATLPAMTPTVGAGASTSAAAPSAAAAATSPAAAPTSAARGPAVELRMAWWGGDARNKMYDVLLDAFQAKNPQIKIARESSDFGPYWEKLSTQVAGGNPPDIMHFNLSYTGEYAKKGVVRDLAPLIGEKKLTVADFDPGILDSGKVDGKLYYVSLGNSAPSVFYNTELLKKVGVAAPTSSWTWDAWAKAVADVAKALGQGYYGAVDNANYGDAIEVFLRQRGKSVFGQDANKLNFAKQDLNDWLALWNGLRKANAIPPMDLNIETRSKTETSLLTTGKAATAMIPGNQLKIYQRLMKDELNLITFPNGPAGSTPANFVVGAYVGIAAKTRYPSECAAVVDWMVNDPDAAKIFKAEHGPPGSTKIREVLRPTLEPADQKVFAFMADVTKTSSAISPQPKTYAEILALLDRTNQDIGFGKKPVDQAVNDFFAEAEKILI